MTRKQTTHRRLSEKKTLDFSVKKKQSNHNQTKSCCFEKAAAKLLRSVALKAKNRETWKITRDKNLKKKKTI
jgi:hypothetical protein